MNMDLKFKDIKSYSKNFDNSINRKLVDVYESNYDEYLIGCAINLLEKESLYEIYLYVTMGKDNSASNLLPMTTFEKEEANEYFNELKKIAMKGDLDYIIKICNEKSI